MSGTEYIIVGVLVAVLLVGIGGLYFTTSESAPIVFFRPSQITGAEIVGTESKIVQVSGTVGIKVSPNVVICSLTIGQGDEGSFEIAGNDTRCWSDMGGCIFSCTDSAGNPNPPKTIINTGNLCLDLKGAFSDLQDPTWGFGNSSKGWMKVIGGNPVSPDFIQVFELPTYTLLTTDVDPGETVYEKEKITYVISEVNPGTHRVTAYFKAQECT